MRNSALSFAAALLLLPLRVIPLRLLTLSISLRLIIPIGTCMLGAVVAVAAVAAVCV